MNIDYNNSIDCDKFCNVLIRKNVISNENEFTVNSTLSYSIFLDNISNSNLYDVYIIEDLIGGLVYVPNSLRINGAVPTCGDINLNETAVIPLGSISASSSTNLITFDVIVKNLPTQVPISNFSRVLYKLNSNIKILNSNMVYSNFCFKPRNTEFIKLVEDSTITNKGLGDLVNFKIIVNPSINMNNVFIKDHINESIQVVDVSIERNGISSSINCSNNILVPLGSVSKNESVIIYITGKIVDKISEISNSIILNQSTLNYTTSYNNQPICCNSNPVYVYIYTPYVKSCKLSDKNCTSIDDIIEYTINLENCGTVPLLDLKLIDVLPKSLEYVKDSAYIQYDNMPCTSVPYDPLTGIICIDILDILESVKICIKAKVISIPENMEIINSASIQYKYLKSPNSHDNKFVYVEEDIKNSCPILIKSADLLSSFKKNITNSCNCGCKQIDYELIFTNNGNVEASNISINDILNNASFIKESISVTTNKPPGNKNYSGELPSIMIDKVVPQETINIRFSVLPNSNLEGKSVTNYAKMSYNYFACNTNPIHISGNSNTVSTLIQSPKIDSILLVDNAEASSIFIGDSALYNLTLKNNTNSELSNVNYKFILPPGYDNFISYIPNSLKIIGGTSGPLNIDPNTTTIPIGTIKPNELVNISFNELGLNKTVKPLVSNFSGVYSFTVPNSDKPIHCNDSSNKVSLSISGDTIPSPNVDLNKEILSYCSPSATGCIVKPVQNVTVGDRVTYKMTVSNLSNQSIKNLILTDTLPSDVTYVPNSLKIDGVTVPYDFSNNLRIGDLPPSIKNTRIVEFDVILNTVPSSSTLTNNACVSYDYIVNPINCKTKTSVVCDSTSTPVIYADLLSNFKKYVDQIGQTENYVAANSSISYILKFENIGNTPASNVVFIDTIPKELGFLEGSTTVDPTLPNGSIIEPGGSQSLLTINFGTVPPGKSYTIQFDTLTNFDILSGDIINNGYLSYSYPVNSNNQFISGNSNSVTSHIRSANVILEKSANYSEVNINVPITYTISAKNIGNSTVNNLYVKDLLPYPLKYIPNTLLLNGLPTNYDINSGVLIGSLPPFNSSTNSPLSTISFQVLANTTPDYNPIANTVDAQYTFVSDPIKGTEVLKYSQSNQVLLDILAADIRPIETLKESDRLILARIDPASNSANYTITLKNSGNLVASNVIVQDTLPNDLSYNYQQPISVFGIKPDGTTINVPFYSANPSRDPNIVDGIILPTVPAGLTVKVKYGYNANSNANDVVDNIGNYSYNYIVNNTTISKAHNTTKATIFIVENAFKVEKLAVPESACPSDTILYTVKTTNITDSTIPNVILQDTLPNGVSLVPGTFTLDFIPFTINGATVTQSDLSLGVNIGTIPGGISRIAQYQANVTGTSIPSLLLNTSTIRYTSVVNNQTIPSSIVSDVAAVTVPSTCPIPKPCNNWCWNPCNSNCNCCTFNNPNICACCVNRNNCKN